MNNVIHTSDPIFKRSFKEFKQNRNAQLTSIAVLACTLLAGWYGVFKLFGKENIKQNDERPLNDELCCSEYERLGSFYFESLYKKNEEAFSYNGEECLKSIVAIVWYLYARAKEQNQGHEFNSGVIVIEDPGWRLYSLLWGYVKELYPHNMYEERMITGCRAYPRKSTHFNSYYLSTKKAKKECFGVIKKRPNYVHYGIDVSVNDLLLPVKCKRHILFGRIGNVNDKQLMFIKLEKAGLNFHDIGQHALGLVKSQIRRKLKKLLSKLGTYITVPHEDQLTNELAKLGKNLSDDTSLVTYRREQIPLKIMAKYIAILLSESSNLNEKVKEFRKQAKSFGIKSMITVAKNFVFNEQGKVEWRAELQKFIDKLVNFYPDWEFRFGNEIILMNKVIISHI